MRYPQLLVYEMDGLIAGMLRNLAEERKWALREPRQAGACLRLLHRAQPAVLVIKIGTDIAREMTLLERVRWLRPEAFTIVLGDMNNPAVATLAWHVGATYVLLPPQPRRMLPALVGSLMERSIERSRARSAQVSKPDFANHLTPDQKGEQS